MDQSPASQVSSLRKMPSKTLMQAFLPGLDVFEHFFTKRSQLRVFDMPVMAPNIMASMGAFRF